jgi:hypothetical protein
LRARGWALQALKTASRMLKADAYNGDNMPKLYPVMPLGKIRSAHHHVKYFLYFNILYDCETKLSIGTKLANPLLSFTPHQAAM